MMRQTRTTFYIAWRSLRIDGEGYFRRVSEFHDTREKAIASIEKKLNGHDAEVCVQSIDVVLVYVESETEKNRLYLRAVHENVFTGQDVIIKEDSLYIEPLDMKKLDKGHVSIALKEFLEKIYLNKYCSFVKLAEGKEVKRPSNYIGGKYIYNV